MAVSTYSDLTTAIATWGTRTYGTSQTDEFILLAEAKINRRLGPQYRRETTTTLTTDANGEATLPSDFISMRSVVRDVVGSAPLIPASWRTLISLNTYEEDGDPSNYAISGSTFKVAPIAEDDFVLRYWAKLTGLGTNNSTNWLLTFAPDIYLYYCRAVQAAFEEEFAQAAIFEKAGNDAMDELIAQGVVAQFGNAEMVLEGITP
jgi:hypothetical protein